MRDEILSYHAMVGRERLNLQAGMNFHVRPGYSIILMSMRKNAPYHDRWDEQRGLLLYEGHNAKNKSGGPDPKTIDQPLMTPRGSPTENGKFFQAASRAARGEVPPERVRVYEKLDRGVWSDKGIFNLVNAEIVSRGGRQVIDFLLQPRNDDELAQSGATLVLRHTRLIPTEVKVEVWKRDRGQCAICDSKENLHYDHDLPFSKGGTSLTAANVRILCAKHNLQKSDRIE